MAPDHILHLITRRLRPAVVAKRVLLAQGVLGVCVQLADLFGFGAVRAGSPLWALEQVALLAFLSANADFAGFRTLTLGFRLAPRWYGRLLVVPWVAMVGAGIVVADPWLVLVCAADLGLVATLVRYRDREPVPSAG